MKDFYTLEAQSPEWVWVITRLIGRYTPTGVDVMISLSGGNPIYHISKKMVPLEDMAKAIGAEPERLAKTKHVRLRPFKQDEWQKPNVPYYGEA